MTESTRRERHQHQVEEKQMSDEPVTASPAPDFSTMSVLQLLNWADAHGIKIPDSVPDAACAQWLSRNWQMAPGTRH